MCKCYQLLQHFFIIANVIGNDKVSNDEFIGAYDREMGLYTSTL